MCSKRCAVQNQGITLSKIVGYFIGVYIINRTLHGCLEIQNFSSHVEKILHSFAVLMHL